MYNFKNQNKLFMILNSNGKSEKLSTRPKTDHIVND